MTYCKIKDGVIVKYNVTQKNTGLGVKSPIETYLAKGWFPLEDNSPTIDSVTQRITGSSYEVQADKVVKTYTVVDIPEEELQAKAVANFKRMYLATVNAKLKELDYDSLATVKLWEGDATFGAEATQILNWYKAIITMNYQLITDITGGVVTMPTDVEYQAMVDAVVF